MTSRTPIPAYLERAHQLLLEELRDHLSTVERAQMMLRAGDYRELKAVLSDIETRFHRCAGAAGLFELTELEAAARDGEDLCGRLLAGAPVTSDLQKALERFQAIADAELGDP